MPKDYTIGRSDTGWMTATSFLDWVRHSFHPWLVKNKIQLPVVLYLDGHSSHLTLQLSEFCRENGIELIALYPNSTHVTQPLDVAVFHAAKNSWKKAVPEWRLANGGDRLKKEHFGGVLEQAVERLDWEKILRSGFRATGLHPFNPDAVNYEKQLKSSGKQRLEEPPAPPINPLMTNLQFIEENIGSQLLQTFKLVDD